MKKKRAVEGTLSSLSGWLERRHSSVPFIDETKVNLFLEYGGFISLDAKIPLYESVDLPAQALKHSWNSTRSYVSRALEIIDDDHPGWLDKEEVKMIIDELGYPPPQCYPIYFISVGKGDDEKLVYVGKTSSSSNRFAGGHAAITKLHRPEYVNLDKTIYLGCVMLLSDKKEYVPLEFVSPLEIANKVLESVEYQLIYNLQPILNVKGKKRNKSKMPFLIHIQNFTLKLSDDESNFLNDKFILPVERL